MVSHKNIDDIDRHEPKGASTASAGQSLLSNGDGTTRWGNVFTFVGEMELSGEESVTFTGIPSTVKTIRVVFYNATGGSPIIRLGDASSIKSAGYLVDVGNFDGLSRKTDGFYMGNTASQSATSRETVDIQRSDSNEFVLSGTSILGSNQVELYAYTGSFNAEGLSIDRVQVRSSGSFTAGSVGLFIW